MISAPPASCTTTSTLGRFLVSEFIAERTIVNLRLEYSILEHRLPRPPLFFKSQTLGKLLHGDIVLGRTEVDAMQIQLFKAVRNDESHRFLADPFAPLHLIP